MLAVCAVSDLIQETGIHVSDITATLQSLGLISLAADSRRCLVLSVSDVVKVRFITKTFSYFIFNIAIIC